MQNSLLRINKAYGEYPKNVGGDRGFWSKENEKWLHEKKIYNRICPRKLKDLKEKLNQSRFRKIQKRRAETESIISIIKNHFIKSPLKSKGFEYRELSVAWSILAHNLWFIAGLPKQKIKRLKKV